jgi:hypothetical protein
VFALARSAPEFFWGRTASRLKRSASLNYYIYGDLEFGAPTAGAPNLIERDFSPALPNQVWTTDITCLATDQGGLCFTNDSRNGQAVLLKRVAYTGHASRVS